MASEVVVRPEGRVGPAAAAVVRGGRGAVGGGVGDADDAAEVGRAEPPLLVVVGAVQLPALILQAESIPSMLSRTLLNIGPPHAFIEVPLMLKIELYFTPLARGLFKSSPARILIQ